MNKQELEPLLAMDAHTIASRVRSRQQSALLSLAASKAQIDAASLGRAGLNAVIHTDADGAMHDAAELGVALSEKQHGGEQRDRFPLAGVPVMVKDNIATLSMPTTCGSNMLAGYISPYEATTVGRLRSAGALMLAKTNMDEFAMGSSTENSAYGPTRNPFDHTRVPGGSSGGSAVAVATGAVRIALGSETGGSVRQPASFCGIVGVKPTYGRVSRFGLVAFASSLDHIGAFGKSVDDAALAMQVISGRDEFDSTSADIPVADYREHRDVHPRQSLAGIVIGWPAEYFPASLDPNIRAHCERARDSLRELGAEIREVTLPHTELAVPVYYIVAPAEASSNLARFDGVRFGYRAESATLRELYENSRSQGFGAEVTRRILLGTYVLSAGYYDAYYKRAQSVRQLIAHDFAKVFASGVHVLLTPTTPTTAFPIGAKTDPYDMYLSDIFTVTANLAGVPAMSLPIGRCEGLPVGGQLIAAHFDEATMFRVAYALEAALGSSAHQ
ncbi:MAG: Asp-tRNA(Asn)/Glu-tRNA(Gln) amidotransferase subunit GatA [Gemmatimonadota bacterium]|nr:Asp-tRNA(Asn)/Glu-tRNA(Gln) amidotransferase subunit GatA [Gemmatimonadota bacterium]